MTDANDTNLHSFTLLASIDRVLARNADGKLIDIGALSREGGDYAYRLDTDDIAGDGFAEAREALRDIAGKISFLYLDGLFTSLPDVAVKQGESWRSWPSLDIRLDAGRVDDERVHRAEGDTPHIF